MSEVIFKGSDLTDYSVVTLLSIQQLILRIPEGERQYYSPEDLEYLNEFIALALIIGQHSIRSAVIGQDMILTPETFIRMDVQRVPWHERDGFKNQEALKVLKKIRDSYGLPLERFELPDSETITR